MAIHCSPEAAIGIESIDSPLLVVDRDGTIQASNGATKALVPGISARASLFSVCLGSPERLRRYLMRCSVSDHPLFEEITFEGNLAFHCLGSPLAPATANRPASILLRLLPAVDRHLSLAGEHIGTSASERRLRSSNAECEELRAEKARILRQYLAVAEALQALELQNRELNEELRRIRAEERERIAQDIHDQAGQELSAAIAEIRLLREQERGSRRRRLDTLAHHLSEVGRRLHRAVVGGMPRIVEELGLVEAIKATAAAYAADGSLRLRFSSSGRLAPAPPPRVASTLYRIAQEAMTNVLKHARTGKNLEVRLDIGTSSISLTVVDDGIGLSPEHYNGENDERVGLNGMRRRMADIGGTLRITSLPGHGTTVEATAPLASRLPAAAQMRSTRP